MKPTKTTKSAVAVVFERMVAKRNLRNFFALLLQ